MKRIIAIVLTVSFVFSNISGICQFANLEFIENKGQWDERVKFKGDMNNGAFFLQERGFRVLLNLPEDLEKMAESFHGVSHSASAAKASKVAHPPAGNEGITVHSHAYNVQFVNAGTPVIVPDKPVSTVNNYFIGNDPAKWKRDCKVFQAITYQNMYPGIDVRYYTNEGKLKYDIIVHPGADISLVSMRFDGVDGLEVKNEQLVIKTSVGEIRELAPYAYQVINGVKKEVRCRFNLGGKTGKTVQFSTESYARNSTLVIDPTLIFSSFSGSSTDNWGYTATYGADGSFYAGGIVFSEGFPTSPGAFMTSYTTGTGDAEGIGSYDIGIIKFSPDGTRRAYATYIGGSGTEQPHSLVVDGQGNLVIGGRTNSVNYPVKAVDPPNGDYDIILTKLNATGSDLIGSRKIGGKGVDGVNIRSKYPLSNAGQTLSLRRNYGDDARSEVILDNEGNIWLASNTQSADFPTTPGAIQRTLAGKQDAVIIKTSPDLSNILVSTFMGGSENDAAFVLAINPSDNNIYVGGNTGSTNLPGNKTGVLHPAFQGGETDGFVSTISNDGNTLIKTSYMGTPGHDMLYGIQFDKYSFPYIMGTTTGTWPVVNAPFSQNGGKQFIAKLKPDLSAYEYSTVFGTNTINPNLSPIAFLVDRCENVYVSGWGGQVNTKGNYPTAGTNNLSVTPDAIKSTTDNSDFYFFVLERGATRQLYGSFFGQSGGFGEHVDGGTSRFDRNGVIYQALCANCGRDVSFPTTPGVWSPNNGSAECNLAAVKIAFNLAGVAGSVRASINGVRQDTTGCVPLTVDFTDTIAAGKRYVWNFGDGSPDIETTTPTQSHTFNAIGTYRVRLISIDESKCNGADTAYTNIRVRTFKGVLGFTSKKENPCNLFNYTFTNTSYVSPAARQFSNISFRWDFGDGTPPVIAGTESVPHSFPGPGVYKVRLELVDTNFCNAPESIEATLRIATNVEAAFTTPDKGCAPYTAVFENTSAGGQQFFWDFGDNTTSNETSPSHLYSIPGTYIIKLKAVDSATCNIVDTTSFTIAVSANPVASFTFTPTPPKENTPVEFANSSIGAVRYKWEFGDGEVLEIASSASVQHTYNESKTYSACLVAFNNFGCADTVCQNVVARITPLLDVPNAFSPNGDGVNDKVYVRGFGIIKMSWRIYNRWGALVFETGDRTQGWDGTYKGSTQPKEVYHYILNVEYANKTKFQKRGDITLLR